jgi:hypothetical protein
MSTDRDGFWMPGKLWSLWDIMRDFEGWRFIALASFLGEFAANHPANDVVIPDEWKAVNVEGLKAYFPVLLHLGMDASHSSLERLIEQIQRPGVKFTDLSLISAELKGRLQDQAQKRLIFALNPKETDFAIRPRSGWETAIDRFPLIGQDVDEAGVCYSLSRYPAAVYHSVQITEIGLIELGRFLKVSDPHSGWTSVANALERVVNKKHAERSAFEKKNFAALEQIQGTVQALKNAWRNKISHVQGRLILLRTDFGSERAEEILMATRAFMRRLAEDLPPAKKKPISELPSAETPVGQAFIDAGVLPDAE